LSYIKTKSEINALSAQFLIDQSLYASSVHCAYYSVFQMLIHKLAGFRNISINQLNQLVESANKSTHKYVVNEFCVHLRSNSKLGFDTYQLRNLKNEIKDLKQFRVESDYHDKEIDSSKSEQALQKSISILHTIKHLQ